ncbi:hypothetical protein H8N03_23400 [Ramlibacter sp. USB13]|uniref:MFS transporter permease n=1 Tax=Ramlibacter cellulosilyticus TaxID=2764187 RepID=A0A923SDD7_9BURK|nr:DUF6064 family protein [Ramlibacter cellulosilyticus]MBC5785905.1 hypothetical protein [Ramlibacter cellulosilyticus]
MPEWGTYGLSDFLMFSPQAYWRLVARANAAWWPAQLLGVAASLALPWMVLRGRGRAALVILAAAWAWVAWSFLARWYAEIFIAAPSLAIAAGAQALLLLAASLAVRGSSPSSRVGIPLLAIAQLYPLLAPLAGHAPGEAETFGFLPDPTALATVGVLLSLRALPRGWRAVLALVPVLALLLGAATRWLVG